MPLPSDVGVAPFLRRDALHNVIELNRAELYEQDYPVQQLFMRSNGGNPALFDAEEFTIETVRDPREEGVYATQMASPKALGDEQYGKEKVAVLHQAYKMRIGSNETALMRAPGVPNSTNDPTGLVSRHRALAEATAARRFQRMVKKTIRTDEKRFVDQITQKTYTINVRNGVHPTVSTNLNVYKVPVDWRTDTTDVIAHMAGPMLRAFIAQAGGPPTHILYSYLLWEVLSENELIREFLIRQQGGGSVSDIPLALLPAPLRTPTQIAHMTHRRAGGTEQSHIFPAGAMTWIRDDGETLGAGFAPNAHNMFGADGYISTHQWEDNENACRILATRSNLAPYIENHDNIMVFDLFKDAIAGAVDLPAAA